METSPSPTLKVCILYQRRVTSMWSAPQPSANWRAQAPHQALLMEPPLVNINTGGIDQNHSFLFCTVLHFGRSRSFRVIQGQWFWGQWFWYQSKARIRLPISRSLWLWSYLAPFSRYGDLLAKNCLFSLHFCYPSLIRCLRSLCSLWNFALKLIVRKLESWGYPPLKTAWS